MRKSILNSKGFSLLEVSVAVGVVAINAMALMHLYSDSAKNKQREAVYEQIAETGKVIQRTLASKASCEINFKGKKIGAELNTLESGVVDPNDNTKYMSTNNAVVSSNLGNGIEIEKYNLISDGGRDYLEVSYKLSENKKKLGMSDIKKRYLLQTVKDSAGDITSCTGEVSDIDRLVDSYTCLNNGGTIDELTGNCHLDYKDIETPSSEECGEGARYKPEYSDGKMKITCQRCTPKKKFVRSSCEKKYKGMNWVNVCYYRSTCEEDPSTTFGVEFYTRGPTNANGGDTGTKNNCYRRRLPCEGEALSLSNANDAALAQAVTAEENVLNAKEQSKEILKYYEEGNLEEAHKLFNYLKRSVDEAVRSSYQAEQAAMLAGTNEAKEAAKRAKKAEEQARKYFNEGFVIFH